MSNLMNSKFFKKRIWIRTFVQVFFFALVASIAVNHTISEMVVGSQPFSFLSSASVHAICPFGGVETIYQYFATGGYLKKIMDSSVVLMWIVFGMTLVLGPVFCGWVCPFGSMQEWVSKLGKKIFKRRFNHFIPYKYDKWLRYLRYIFLSMLIYNTIVTATLFFANNDPFFLMFHFWTGEVVAAESIIFLALTVIGSLFVERPWCKYLCPYGAVLGVFNLFSIFKIKRQESTCTSCTLCTRTCPMNIPVDKMKAVNDHQCIRCLECTSEAICPVGDTVTLSAGK